MREDLRDAWVSDGAHKDQLHAGLAAHPDFESINDEYGAALWRVVALYRECGANLDEVVSVAVRSAIQHYLKQEQG